VTVNCLRSTWPTFSGCERNQEQKENSGELDIPPGREEQQERYEEALQAIGLHHATNNASDGTDEKNWLLRS
jgi:hypothetical protein